MLKVVLDTNVLISGSIANLGNPHFIINAWRNQEFILVTSQEILDEVERVFQYTHIQKKYHPAAEQIEKFTKLLTTQSIMVDLLSIPDVIPKDPEDNKILATALAGKANYLVTGDSHILLIEHYNGVEIVSPTTFVAVLRRGSKS